MAQGSNVTYYDLKDLKEIVTRLCSKIKCLQSAGDTNMANTDLVFTGSRTYDGANATITYNDVGSLDLNTIGATGIQLTNDTNGLDYSALEIASGRIDLTTSAFGSTVSHLNLSGTEVVVGNAGGAYFLGDGFTTIPPTLDNAQDQLVAIDETNGRLYRRTVASIGGGADTNFAANNLTFTANRTHNASNNSLTINNIDGLNLNTGTGNQSLVMDNTGNGIVFTGNSQFGVVIDPVGTSIATFSIAPTVSEISSNTGTESSAITMLPGLRGITIKDSQSIYYFGDSFGSMLPLLDGVGEPQEGNSDKMLTVTSTGLVLRKELPAAGQNFATTDLTFTGSRTHDAATNDLGINDIGSLALNATTNIQIKLDNGSGDTGEFQGGIGYSYIAGGNGTDNASVVADSANGVSLSSSLGIYTVSGLPEYADDTAAGVGGLIAGRLYRTATGVVMVKL